MHRWILAVFVVAAALVSSVPHAGRAQNASPVAGPVQQLQFESGQIVGLSPDGSRIAVLDLPLSLCIYETATLAEPVCASLELLDSDPGSDAIVWSPDSARLAIAELGLLLGKDADLWIVDAATGELTNLTDDGYTGSLLNTSGSGFTGPIFVDGSPAWTPDGQFITFARSTWTDGAAAGTSIAQVPADGGTVETLASVTSQEPGAVYSHTAWTPDGALFLFTRIASSEGDPSENGIWAFDAASGSIFPIAAADDPSLGVLTLLEVSPAGDQLLAWYPEAHGRFEVDSVLLRLVDLDPEEVTTPVLPDSVPASLVGMSVATFAPDGSGLLLMLPTMGASDQLWLAPSGEAEPVLLLDEIGVETGNLLDWASDGTILIAGLSGQGALTSLAIEPVPTASPLTALSWGTGQVLGGSPDGAKVAVLEQRVSLCIVEIATQQEVSCASLENAPITPRPEDVIWSPDGTRLAFTEMGYTLGTDSDLWLMDVATGELTNLTDDGFVDDLFGLGGELPALVTVDASPAWTPDGQFISFARTNLVNGESTGTTLARIAAAGGSVEELARVSETEPGVVVHRSAWSPDGATLYYSYSSASADDPRNGVWTYDPATGLTAPLAMADGQTGGAPALLHSSPTGASLLVWYPQVFVGTQIADPLIRLVDTATGEITFLELPPPDQATLPARIAGTFSPDGASILYLLVPVQGPGQLWVSDPLSGDATRVMENIENAKLDPRFAPTWSTNGVVVMGLIDSSAAVTTIDMGGGSASASLRSLRELVSDHNPSWAA